MRCEGLAKLLRAERPALEKEFLRHKERLIKESGFNISYKTAQRHYLANNLDAWARGFKGCYCSVTCEYRSECNIKTT